MAGGGRGLKRRPTVPWRWGVRRCVGEVGGPRATAMTLVLPKKSLEVSLWGFVWDRGEEGIPAIG